MTRERWGKLALVVGLLVVAATGGFVLWQRGNYHQWPWQSLPDRLDHCDRSYAPGDRVSVHDSPHLEFAFAFEPELAAHHDVYAEPGDRFTNDQGEECPMVYFMRDGSSYVQFGLLGGP